MISKLSRLTTKESSGEQSLDGVYRVVVDLRLASGKNITVKDIEKKLSEAGQIEDIVVERHEDVSSPFTVGDTVELAADLDCTKTVYLDTFGNYIISDRPVADRVEKVGDYAVHLSKGTVAEVNNKSTGRDTEVLFTGEMVSIDGLDKVAFLGILELPCNLFIKTDC